MFMLTSSSAGRALAGYSFVTRSKRITGAESTVESLEALAADQEVWTVCCEGLVCAACSGQVSEGGCPVCRAYRDQHHYARPDWSGFILPLVAAVLGLVLVLALHAHFG
jgi:hypothetical protein